MSIPVKFYNFFDADQGGGFIEYDINGEYLKELFDTCAKFCRLLSFRENDTSLPCSIEKQMCIRDSAYTTGALGELLDEKTYSYSTGELKDQLTSFDGMEIQSDALGNIFKILLDEETSVTYYWQHGRQLKQISTGNPTRLTNVVFSYDANGNRTEVFADGYGTYNYYYAGDTLSYMTVGINTLRFTYDGTSPASVNYNGTEYFYLKNALGDICGIVDSAGNLVVE